MRRTDRLIDAVRGPVRSFRACAAVVTLLGCLIGCWVGGCDGEPREAPHPPETPAPIERPPVAPSVANERSTLFEAVPRPPATPIPPADARIAIARAMLRNERFGDAERALRVVLSERPDDAQAELLLGLAIQKQKRYAEARPRFERVIALRQSFAEVDHVFYLLGWANYYLGDGRAAREAFEEHLRRVPGEADSIFALGLIAFDEDRQEDAERHFREAIALQIDDPRAARERAKAQARLSDVLVRTDRIEEAEKALRESVRLHADHYEAWAKLARVLDRLGRSDEAAVARDEEAAALRRAGRAMPPAPTP